MLGILYPVNHMTEPLRILSLGLTAQFMWPGVLFVRTVFLGSAAFCPNLGPDLGFSRFGTKICPKSEPALPPIIPGPVSNRFKRGPDSKWVYVNRYITSECEYVVVRPCVRLSNEPIEVPFSHAMPLVACGSIVRNCNLKLLIDGSDDPFVLYDLPVLEMV